MQTYHRRRRVSSRSFTIEIFSQQSIIIYLYFTIVRIQLYLINCSLLQLRDDGILLKIQMNLFQDNFKTEEKSMSRNKTFIILVLCLAYSMLLPGPNNIIQAHNSSIQNKDGMEPLAYIESGPVQQAISSIDSSEIDMPTDILWTVFYSSYPEGFTRDDLEQFVKQRRISRAGKSYKVIDNTPASSDSRSLNILFLIDSSVPSAAETALGEVEAYLESMFADPLTVIINVDFASLPGGVLGATGTYYTANPPSWGSARYYMINDMDDDDFIQDYLPSSSYIPVRYNGSSSTVTNETSCYFAWANYGAIGYSISGTSAETSFNSNVSWDYNPANGVPSYLYCFQSVAIHEFAHALGFVSRAESWYEPNYDIYALDIYRFQFTDGSYDYNPDTYTEFQTTPRLVDYNTPNDNHISNIFYSNGANVEYRMSDGDPYQASHFRTDVDGIMQPTIAAGETYYPDFYKTSDINMLDAIGWDYSIDLGYQYLPGDANMPNGLWPPEVIGSDVTYLVNYFRGESVSCLLDGFYCSADVNGDCDVIGSDVTKLVSYFRGMTGLEYCPDYEPVWLAPDDCPADAPSGWPNCD
jgi:hypothetical protein